MSQVARVEKFEKIMLGHPLISLYLQKPLRGPQSYKSGWYLSILDFWPKTISFHVVMHIKATQTLWFGKKTQLKSVFFSFGVILGSFWGRQRAQSDFCSF